jgi:hypothetical protein
MPRFGDQARKKKDLERKERAAQARAEKKNVEETARLDKNYSNWSEKRKSNKQAKEKINSIFEKKRGLAGVEAFKKNFATNKEIKHQLDIQEAEDKIKKVFDNKRGLAGVAGFKKNALDKKQMREEEESFKLMKQQDAAVNFKNALYDLEDHRSSNVLSKLRGNVKAKKQLEAEKQAESKLKGIFEKKRGLAGVEAFKKNFAANKEIKHQLDIQEAEKQPEIVPEPETVSFVPEPEIVSRSFRRTLNKHKSLAQRLREVNRDINSIK